MNLITEMIIIYIFCNNLREAESIGRQCIKKRLCPCYNIIPRVHSAALWPPNTGKTEKGSGSILLVKTLEHQFRKIEAEVKKMHSDTNPCIFSLPVSHVSSDYLAWLKSEIE